MPRDPPVTTSTAPCQPTDDIRLLQHRGQCLDHRVEDRSSGIDGSRGEYVERCLGERAEEESGRCVGIFDGGFTTLDPMHQEPLDRCDAAFLSLAQVQRRHPSSHVG